MLNKVIYITRIITLHFQRVRKTGGVFDELNPVYAFNIFLDIYIWLVNTVLQFYLVKYNFGKIHFLYFHFRL